MIQGIENGIILQIYLEKFVTYDKVVIKPGRNLNLIIGPNGTGKSTIVCGIVLGLGGKPSLIGRAPHVGSYVKAGCDQAKIEITLKKNAKHNAVITRIIHTNGNSSWLLDNQVVNVKMIQELTSSFNIQVDNLCQFLPQDKVQDFSKMNAQQLLENTERSVGDPMLLEYHTQLKDYRVQHKELEKQIKSKEGLRQLRTEKYNSLKEVVSTIKEKKTIKKKIVSLKQKKAWMVYDEARKLLVESKKRKDTAAAKKQSIQAKLKPVEQIMAKMKSEINVLESSVKDHNNKILIKTTKAKEILDDILKCENSIIESEKQCNRRIEAEGNRDKEIRVEQQQKSKLDNDLSLMIEETGTEESLVMQQREIMSRIERKRNIIDDLMNQSAVLKQKEENLNREIRAKEAEHQNINVEDKRLELLKRISRDAYDCVFWLRQNKNKFSAPVHEPILLNTTVKEPSHAKFLESIVPVQDLIAFVCENKQDMNLLLKYLRDQGRQVNAVHSDPNKKVYMEPNIPIENIEKFGFKHYLVSLIEAPMTITKYLVSMYRLNNIPVGSNKVEDYVDHIPQSLNCFFSDDNCYSVSMSKYTGAKSTRMSRISGNGYLSIVLDKLKLHRIEENLKVLKEAKDNTVMKINEIDQRVSEESKELEKYRNEKNKYRHDVQQIQMLKSRIHLVERKIEVLQNERTSVEEIKKNTTITIQKSIYKQMEVYKRYNSLLEECFKSTAINEEIKLKLKLKQRSLIDTENSCQELRDQYVLAENEYKRLEEELEPLTREAKKLYNEARESTNNISPGDQAFRPFNTIFNKLPPTIQEINNELQIAQAKVFCMGKNVDGENVIQEYEEAEADIQSLSEYIEAKTRELGDITQKTEQLREKWLPPLEQLVERINTNFSSHFSDMKCAGEVTLFHGENSMDYDRYGLKIRVKFRDSDELQELTEHHQSGGERAVTTAIYMIALQELCRVPFRCVDEINQGMDASNERRVFELLVKITGKPDSSQYFLLTPKLLPNLSYTDTVTVHCVFNGPFMIDSMEFDTKDYCKQIVKRQFKRGHER